MDDRRSSGYLLSDVNTLEIQRVEKTQCSEKIIALTSLRNEKQKKESLLTFLGY